MIHVIWEFTVSATHQAAFETAYKSDGVWAQLFRRDPAYCETILVRDRDRAGRYLTIDLWEDRESYLRFKDRFAHDYRKIDKECEQLTENERLIGMFEEVI
ncbi:MAG TPA: antibiotic biosynthesis monooxygenase [Terriglobales bacterium]|nr:antibiotic biosynthesis monooxygenase [Terriglobales bacterium]